MIHPNEIYTRLRDFISLTPSYSVIRLSGHLKRKRSEQRSGRLAGSPDEASIYLVYQPVQILHKQFYRFISYQMIKLSKSTDINRSISDLPPLRARHMQQESLSDSGSLILIQHESTDYNMCWSMFSPRTHGFWVWAVIRVELLRTWSNLCFIYLVSNIL